ncbi:hypothetical protein LARV_00984 [Longilinea arvoryzae]|uniref:Transposase n=1 Tax=Longilinea arvoryzae TaxID=360412 RepID=A0A0S7BHD7_9CHLR|nr:hypothetical protein LARV_00984 [Longilinea arvoryzae]
MKYMFMAAHEGEYAVKRMCKVLRVQRSGYYAWRKRKSVLTAIAARAETVTTAPTPTEPTPDQTLTPSLSPGLPPKKWTRKKGESGKLNGKEARK